MRRIRRAEFTVLRHADLVDKAGSMDLSTSRDKLLSLRQERLRLREDIAHRREEAADAEQQRKEIANLQSLSRGTTDKDIAALLAEREWEVEQLRRSLAELQAL